MKISRGYFRFSLLGLLIVTAIIAVLFSIYSPRHIQISGTQAAEYGLNFDPPGPGEGANRLSEHLGRIVSKSPSVRFKAQRDFSGEFKRLGPIICEVSRRDFHLRPVNKKPETTKYTICSTTFSTGDDSKIELGERFTLIIDFEKPETNDTMICAIDGNGKFYYWTGWETIGIRINETQNDLKHVASNINKEQHERYVNVIKPLIDDELSKIGRKR